MTGNISHLCPNVSSKAAFTTKRLREKGRDCSKITMWANGDDVGDFASQPKYLSISVVSQILVHIIVHINMISSTVSLWTSFCSQILTSDWLHDNGVLGFMPRHNSPLAAAAAFQALPRASTTPSGDLQSSLAPRLVVRLHVKSNNPTTGVPRIRSPCGTWIETQWHGLDSWLEFCGKKTDAKPGSKSPPLLLPVLMAPFYPFLSSMCLLGKSPMSDIGGPSDKSSNLQMQGGPFIYEVFWPFMSEIMIWRKQLQQVNNEDKNMPKTTRSCQEASTVCVTILRQFLWACFLWNNFWFATCNAFL